MTKYQTIHGFLNNPFNGNNVIGKIREYEQKYQSFISSNKIKIGGFTENSGAYYIHVKIPSESSKEEYYYDVVIRFFTDKPSVEASNTLSEYYIQFFSNSPGFIYHYAALYKKHGFLIESLYNKLDPEFQDIMPEQTNAKMELSFDKSIFFACRYLSDRRFRALDKRGILLNKKKNVNAFFADISDFKSVKYDQELMIADKRLKAQMEDQRRREKTIEKRKLDTSIHHAKTSTSKMSSVRVVGKRIGIKAGGRVAKKTATKSTRKR